MAGSYRHCCGHTFDRDGDPAEFTHAGLENLGDALEACEEMHWMIWHLAGGDAERIWEAHRAFYSREPVNPKIVNPTYRDEE